MSTVKHTLEKTVDELEQYGRRVCLHNESVEHKVKEKSEEILKKIDQYCKRVWNWNSWISFGRAHCIGPTYTDNDTNNAQIRLDLIKDLYNLLVSPRKRVTNCPAVNYVYADVNCRLKVKSADESHKFFESMKEMIFFLTLIS